MFEYICYFSPLQSVSVNDGNCFYNNILIVWNKKIHIGGVFCDLTKTFDCVNHDILVVKLEHYGIQATTLKWFKSYLMDRKERVKINVNVNQTHYSTWETVKPGVPQGSVLRPLLFTLYINDLPNSVTHDSKVIHFADDTSVLVTDKDCTKFKQKMNLALMSLDRWFTVNRLMLNITKTKCNKIYTKNYSICTRGHVL
jgi:hypothetical protein